MTHLDTDRFDESPKLKPAKTLFSAGTWSPEVPPEVRKRYENPVDSVADTSQPKKKPYVVVHPRSYGQRDHLMPEILQLRVAGMSWAKIGQHFKISEDSVRRLHQRAVAKGRK